LIDGGFDISELTINVGDTVEWINVRDGRMDKALIVGVQRCSRVKSSIYHSGESFSYTFAEPGTCVIVDGIFTTQLMKVIVEE